MSEKHCVQCGGKISRGYEVLPPDEDKYCFLYVCTNPKCPNYGLFALPREFMPNENNNSN